MMVHFSVPLALGEPGPERDAWPRAIPTCIYAFFSRTSVCEAFSWPSFSPSSTAALTMTTKTKGVTVKDVTAAQFITEYAAHLKRNQWLKLPSWIDLVKTGVAKELAPIDPDWYYIRAGAYFFLFS